MPWSARVAGLVRKKKPRVRWKRQIEVMIVLADMSAMVAVVGGCLPEGWWKVRGGARGSLGVVVVVVVLSWVVGLEAGREQMRAARDRQETGSRVGDEMGLFRGQWAGAQGRCVTGEYWAGVLRGLPGVVVSS